MSSPHSREGKLGPASYREKYQRIMDDLTTTTGGLQTRRSPSLAPADMCWDSFSVALLSCSAGEVEIGFLIEQLP